MNTAPGIMPCSNSSSSRTSRKVDVADARFGVGRRDLADLGLRLLQQIAETRHHSSTRVDSTLKCYRSGRIFPTGQTECRQGGEHLAELVPDDDVGDRIERCLLGVQDHESSAVPDRDLGQRGGGIHGERRADREEHVGAARRELRPLEVGRRRGSRRS